MYVIGLDIGTSGVKSTLFDDSARVVGHAYAEYNLIFPAPGMAELSAEALWEKSLQVLGESIKNCGANELKAICITSFGESFVCLDEARRPLSDTMIYMDTRGEAESHELALNIPRGAFYNVTGHYADPMFAICKLRWLNLHRPEIMKQTRKICFIADYIALLLGAEHMCDYSLAARSAMFDIRKKEWWSEALSFAGIPEKLLPVPVPSGSVTGRLSPGIAAELGVTGSTRIIIGGHDQILAAIGTGVNTAGDIANGMGTVDCMTAIIGEGQLNMEALLKYNIQISPYAGQSMYAAFAFNMSGGCTLKWFRDTLCQDVASLPEAYQIIDREAAQGPTDLLVLPYLAGGGTPYMDADTPAVLAGLRLRHTRGELSRAFMEGSAYEMRRNLDCLSQSGIEANRIVAVGGGSGSDLWMQIRADVFGKEIFRPANKEAGTLASALLCYVSLGIYSSIAEAQNSVVRFSDRFAPQRENAALYSEHYSKYLKLYDCMKEFYRC
jgi:xylulokinase